MENQCVLYLDSARDCNIVWINKLSNAFYYNLIIYYNEYSMSILCVMQYFVTDFEMVIIRVRYIFFFFLIIINITYLTFITFYKYLCSLEQ